MDGQAQYISARCKNKPYLTCEVGDHFGLIDIVYRLRAIKQEKEKKQQRKELKQLRKQQKKRQRKPDISDEEVSSISDEDQDENSSSESSDQEDFATISQKIRYKFTIRAQKTC